MNNNMMMNKKDEDDNDNDNNIGKKVYRKLSWFYSQKLPIHFCLLDKFGWKNGNIVELDEKRLTLVLDEFKEGKLPFLCEEINIDTIKKFTPGTNLRTNK